MYKYCTNNSWKNHLALDEMMDSKRTHLVFIVILVTVKIILGQPTEGTVLQILEITVTSTYDLRKSQTSWIC